MIEYFYNCAFVGLPIEYKRSESVTDLNVNVIFT
jgi:hypothetical protein